MSRQLRTHFHLASLFLLCAVQTEIHSHPYYYMPTRNIYISHVVTIPQHRYTKPISPHYDFLYEQPPRYVQQTQQYDTDKSISYMEAEVESKDDERKPEIYNGNTLIVHGGGGMSRIKTCQGYHDRINPLSGSCETLGTQGSCGDLEIFVGNEETNPEDRTYGHCECDYERYAQPLVSVGGQCHFLYTQATCLPGYWLTMSSTLGGPVCRINPCWQMMSNNHNGSGFEKRVFMALYKGKCVEVDSPGSNMLCSRENEVVTFVRGSLEPKCMAVLPPPRIRRRQITRPHQVACGPGMIRIRDKCLTFVVVEVDEDDEA